MQRQRPSNVPSRTDAGLALRLEQELKQNVFLCYQCIKCTSGCPLAEFFDWQPHQIMKALQLGEDEVPLRSATPWLCASCQTCSTRCPQGLDVTSIMEFLTRESKRRGFRSHVREVDIFNEAFLRQVRLWGRAYDLGMMGEMRLRAGKFTRDLDLAAKMLRRNKLAFLPSPACRLKESDPKPPRPNSVAYYPGCSLHSTAAEFDISARAVCQALGIELVEPKGWVCCGSTAAHRSDPSSALKWPLHNLEIIERGGFSEVTMPCASCFNRHKVAQYEIARSAPISRQGEANGYEFNDSMRVSTLVETITRLVGSKTLAAKVRRPLNGLRVCCYYGCLLTRPPDALDVTHPENPTEMDQLLQATGLEVIDWSYKTSCCGASHSLTRPDIVVRLSRELIEQAGRAGAEAIAVACPLCHFNLDARQAQMKLPASMPILYFTQLLALALDLPPRAVCLHKNLTDPRPLLKTKAFE
ncbi:MAG TPA: heterodisulfide reductase-related iron-sulfur binding cluster [Acidobacteriota bacterium]|nr:heterodisulfide reductase-related iron-sulfur binding cluster [Acidobacteriota bacterium]